MPHLETEPKAKSGLHDQCSYCWAIEAELMHIFLLWTTFLIIEGISRRHDVYDAISYQVNKPVNDSLIKGQYDYSNLWKEGHEIIIRDGVWLLLKIDDYISSKEEKYALAVLR